MQLSICLPEMPLTVTPEQFMAITAANRDLRIERTANGELIVNPPTGSESSRRNLSITAQLWNWAENHPELGVAFESSGGFSLPDGSTRAPDASWVSCDRWEALSPSEKEGFAPLCPDFVVELRSKTDNLSALQGKMREYIDNGSRLGWLINPQNRQVEIYRSGDKTVEILEKPDTLSGEEVLPGFVMSLTRIWS